MNGKLLKTSPDGVLWGITIFQLLGYWPDNIQEWFMVLKAQRQVDQVHEDEAIKAERERVLVGVRSVKIEAPDDGDESYVMGEADMKKAILELLEGMVKP